MLIVTIKENEIYKFYLYIIKLLICKNFQEFCIKYFLSNKMALNILCLLRFWAFVQIVYLK